MYGKKKVEKKLIWWRLALKYDNGEEFAFGSDDENELENIKDVQFHGEDNSNHFMIEDITAYNGSLDQTRNSSASNNAHSFRSSGFPSWMNLTHLKRYPRVHFSSSASVPLADFKVFTAFAPIAIMWLCNMYF